MKTYNLVPAGLGELWGGFPAVALRSTAGYAHHTPCGVSDEQSSPYRNYEGRDVHNRRLSEA
ncbi:MAG: hypothetical protein LBU34_10715 [Planctomycetaceae bacterium]|nr:hypothetical protein [Planctomycetaceae bacterium]